MINSDKLKGRMKEKRITQYKLADALNIKEPTCNLKINNKRPMTLDEANLTSELLGIDCNEFHSFFFANELQNATNKAT